MQSTCIFFIIIKFHHYVGYGMLEQFGFFYSMFLFVILALAFGSECMFVL